MSKSYSLLALAAVAILCLVYIGYSVKQKAPLIDRYETCAAGDVDVKQFHLWLTLFNGTDWTGAQAAELITDARHPEDANEKEIIETFGAQAKQIFGGVGSYDIRDLRAVYHAETLADKKELMRLDRGTIWRQWMALYATEHPDLSDGQIEAFYQVSRWTDNAASKTRKEADAFAESIVVPAFGKEQAKEIFGPIGAVKFAELCQKAHGPSDKVVVSDCACSYGSYWNWSCGNGTCKEIDGSCNRLPDSCGFLGYYACDSSCGPAEIQ